MNVTNNKSIELSHEGNQMSCSGRETIFKISICFDKIISVPERFVKGRPRFLLNSWFGIEDTRACSLFYGR